MTKKLINKIKKSKMIFKTLKPEGTVTTALKYKQ